MLFFIKRRFGSDIDIRQFSDSIVVSMPLIPLQEDNIIKIIDIARNIQSEMLKRSILSRGGISFGKHFSENDFLFSDALINAYILEKEHAKNPRIIISNDLLGISENTLLFSEGRLIKEDDDRYFVNYLNLISGDECNKILNSIFSKEVKKDYSIMEKYRWLFEYATFCFQSEVIQKRFRFQLN